MSTKNPEFLRFSENFHCTFQYSDLHYSVWHRFFTRPKKLNKKEINFLRKGKNAIFLYIHNNCFFKTSLLNIVKDMVLSPLDFKKGSRLPVHQPAKYFNYWLHKIWIRQFIIPPFKSLFHYYFIPMYQFQKYRIATSLFLIPFSSLIRKIKYGTH